MQNIVTKIDNFIKNQPWLDFEIIEYSDYSLTIIGSLDTSAEPIIRIEFAGVFAISAPFNWKTDTDKSVFSILGGVEMLKFNQVFEVEQGVTLFRFIPEDLEGYLGCIIAAQEVSYRTSPQ